MAISTLTRPLEHSHGFATAAVQGVRIKGGDEFPTFDSKHVEKVVECAGLKNAAGHATGVEFDSFVFPSGHFLGGSVDVSD